MTRSCLNHQSHNDKRSGNWFRFERVMEMEIGLSISLLNVLIYSDAYQKIWRHIIYSKLEKVVIF